MQVDIGIDDENDSDAETEATELAEEALQSLSLNYPGVVEFAATFADAEKIEEV